MSTYRPDVVTHPNVRSPLPHRTPGATPLGQAARAHDVALGGPLDLQHLSRVRFARAYIRLRTAKVRDLIQEATP